LKAIEKFRLNKNTEKTFLMNEQFIKIMHFISFIYHQKKKKVSLIIQQNKLSYNQYEALNFPTALFYAKLERFNNKSDGKQGK
jgi:hypothetical protein